MRQHSYLYRLKDPLNRHQLLAYLQPFVQDLFLQIENQTHHPIWQRLLVR